MPTSVPPLTAGARLGGRQAEVAEPGVAVVVEPDVGGLQVAVDDAARVRVLERAGDVGGDLDRALDLEAPARPLRAGPRRRRPACTR